MKRRVPMDAPDLPGYRYLRLIGTGGYSDVFLYEQQMPQREVAVKVLLPDEMGERARRDFTSEANTMASLSTHPYIVSIIQADVAPDGRPYLVMEYYPRDNLWVRCRHEQMHVAEVLRIGIQMAAAVETAHRAGILHRDIKPSNILTSAYNWPGLTDFGIAASAVDSSTETAGVSIPWAPHEVVMSSGVGTEAGDIYSLGATIYTLLAGRSPFEVKGQSNKHLDLLRRIDQEAPQPIDRPDVPASLERLLRQAMAKQSDDRHRSAEALGKALQEIESELRLPLTALEIRTEPIATPERIDDDGDETRFKAPVEIDAQPSAPRPPSADPGPAAPRTPDLITGIGSIPVGSDGFNPGSAALDEVTVGRRTAGDTGGPRPADAPAASLTDEDPPGDATPSQMWSSLRGIGIVAASAGLLMAIVLVLVARPPIDDDDDDTGSTSVVTLVDDPDPIEQPTDVEVESLPGGGALVTWDVSEPEPGDRYRVRRSSDGRVLGTTEAMMLEIDGLGEDGGCIGVSVIRNGRASDPTSSCA